MSAPLALARYRVTLEALERLDLPAYLGSTLRGAFGHAFPRLCCLRRDGESCPAPALCPYHLIFETAPPPDAGALRTHEEIPRPFVIAPLVEGSSEHPAGSRVAFDLTLVGRAREQLACFVVTLREIDRIGRGRRRVMLRQVDAVHPLTGASEVVYLAGENLVRPREASVTLAEGAAVACPEGPMRVTFATQTRLKRDGAFARRPDFQLLFRRILGRLSALARFHGDGPLAVDFRGLIEAAGAVQLVRDDTRWTRWPRYSQRQDRRMEWEGLVGTVRRRSGALLAVPRVRPVDARGQRDEWRHRPGAAAAPGGGLARAGRARVPRAHLEIITGRLEPAGIAYMVTGSMAMNYYALPRMTRDIDVVVELEG